MLPLEFDAQFQRLRNHWSDRQFTSEFGKLLFGELKKLPDGLFEGMVSFLILNAPRAPLLQDFKDAAAHVIKEAGAKYRRPRAPCEVCNSWGYFLVKDESSGSIATASCESCSNGAELRANSGRPIIGLRAAQAKGYLRVKKLEKPEPENPEAWVSAQAPGTPASVEAMCMMIQSGRSNHSAFRWALRTTNLSEPEAWTVYESWLKGVVHPLALKQKRSLVREVLTHGLKEKTA